LLGFLVEKNYVLSLVGKLACCNKASEPCADDYYISFTGAASSRDYVRCPE
jgi:hypothetical protein